MPQCLAGRSAAFPLAVLLRPGYGNIRQVAVNQGIQDGLYTGSRDAQRGQSCNPQRSHFYKNGHGDNGGYGLYGNSYPGSAGISPAIPAWLRPGLSIVWRLHPRPTHARSLAMVSNYLLLLNLRRIADASAAASFSFRKTRTPLDQNCPSG